MSSLQVATASFASTPASGSLIATHKLNAERPEYRSFANVVYRKNSEVQFVGAATTTINTAVMPSHQVLDCIIVFAINTTGTTPPLVPAGEGWITLISEGTLFGATVAYKFALTNTETVGSWVLSDRTTVAVYRNVRDINQYRVTENTNKNKIRFGYLSKVQPSGGNLLVAINCSRDVTDNDNHTDNTVNIRASTHLNDPTETGPGLTLADRLVQSTSLNVPTNRNIGTIWNAVHGDQIGIHLNLEAGKPTIHQDVVPYQTTLNGTAVARTLFVTSKRFEVNLTEFLFLYQQFLDVDTGNFGYSVSSPTLGKGFYLHAESAAYALTGEDITEVRALRYGWPGIAVTPYVFAGSTPNTELGFFVNPQNGSFASTYGSIGLTHQAIVLQTSTPYLVEVDATFIRFLIAHLSGNSFTQTFRQIGLRNDGLSITGGRDTGRPPSVGGSTPSSPSFLRPALVEYNSVHQSRDLGKLNNFLGKFTGEIGSQVGTSTIYFKLETLGPADIKVNKNPINKYTDNYISINVLNSERKLVEVNDFGFAYNNEIVNTDKEESVSSLPAGVYYFTVSTNTWQAVPYSVTIQAIRFTAIEGAAIVSATLAGRFAISKMRGAATLPGPFEATIPPFDRIKQPAGPALVSSGSRGTLVIPSGVAVGRMLPSGRLKETHKISGHSGGAMPNVATLSSQPPYGGYGP